MADDKIRCDMPGCAEAYPVEHDQAGVPGFERGKWLGWFYLDLNRPDLANRPLRFCSFWCLRWWIENTTTADRPVAAEDQHHYIPPQARVDELATRRRTSP